MARRELRPVDRSRGVTAVLGPTNTGKTHLAIERMLGHVSGMIGLPLRLLAREVYNRVVERVGPDAVALVTGEEKIKPKNPRYWVATVEAMPRDLELAFVAIDEIQLVANLDRGHVFTDRLLNMRGYAETLIVGAGTMRPLVEQLLPGVHIVTRPRLSNLAFAGEKKLTRLPPRVAIVTFSAEEVYAIAEVIRRQRGGAAVVLGALSPRTRNAQVALYQSGDVDHLVATDAIGMGLNLDVDHVAFASDRKFDGHGFRRLNPAEFGQIAGRAGRHLRDGTFGTTGRCDGFEPELVQAIEDHAFDPVRIAQWRNPVLDFRSIGALAISLSKIPEEQGLTRAPIAEDMSALEAVAREEDIRAMASRPGAVERLWECCQIPDYRKVSPSAHAELVGTVYRALMTRGRVEDDWFARQIALVDRVDGDIPTLSARIAQVRSWTFVANRPDWLGDPEHWQGVARQVEDRLSDALHERLAQRFVDRRTSVLMRRLRENTMLEAEITATGDVVVEGQHVGQLTGFQFVPDSSADGSEAAKALRAAAVKALAGEIEKRAEKLAAAPDEAFVLANDGIIRWTGDPVGRLLPGDKIVTPQLRIVADEHLTGPARDSVQKRLDLWVTSHIGKLLGPLKELETSETLTGIARGIAFQIGEALGVLERSQVASDVKSLDQEQRGALRKLGVRFGAYHLYLPALLKPAPRALASQLWALKHGGGDVKGLVELSALASSGRTSIPVDAEIPKGLYRAAGFRVCGGRALRVDILERLADLIRPAIAYRPGTTIGDPPVGAADDDGFVVTGAMTSLAGCSGEDFGAILKSLGYQSVTRPGPAITKPIIRPAPTRPVAAPVAETPVEPAADTPAEGEAPADAEAGETPSAEVESAAATDTAEATNADAGTEEPAVAESVTAVETPAPVEAAAPVEAVSDVAVPDAAPAEAAPETGAAETSASDSGEVPAPEAAVPAAAPAEAPMIEVWRPHRQQHNFRRPPHRERPTGAPQGAPGEAGQRRPFEQRRPWRGDRPAAPGQPSGPGPAGEGAHARGPRPPRADVAVPGAGDAPGAGGAPANRPMGPRPDRPPRREDRPHGDRPHGDRPHGDRPHGDRPPRPPGQGPRPDQGGRGDRGPRPDRGGRREEREAWSQFAAPPRQDRREPDPDSPFAKLAALKAKLEGKS